MLLLATPALVDPSFTRAVVLMLHHSPDGAIGLVLNRLATEPAEAALQAWLDHCAAPQQLFAGGPVEPNGYIALAAGDGAVDMPGWEPVLGDIGVIDLGASPTRAVDCSMRIFRGYAGWGAGQLEDELSSGAWLVLERDRRDAFTPQPATLWRDVLRRQPGSLARLADAPDDLSVN